MKTLKPSKTLRAWLDIREDICRWYLANHINPNQVPAAAIPTIRDSKITVDIYRHRNGAPYVVPSTDEIARGTLTVPLTVQPPAVLAAWLRGEVPYPQGRS